MLSYTPLAPLVEGNEQRIGERSTEIPHPPKGGIRNDRSSAIGKVIAKCHSERREESLFSVSFGERSFEIPLRQPADRNDRGIAIENTLAEDFYWQNVYNTPLAPLIEGNERTGTLYFLLSVTLKSSPLREGLGVCLCVPMIF